MVEVKDGLYHLIMNEVFPIALVEAQPSLTNNTSILASTISNSRDFNLYHYRLGHLSNSRVSLVSKEDISEIPASLIPCSVCPLAKLHKLHFAISHHRSEKWFDLIHCDLWEPCNEVSHDRSRYFHSIVDDFSRCTWVYMLKLKSDASTLLQQFWAMNET